MLMVAKPAAAAAPTVFKPIMPTARPVPAANSQLSSSTRVVTTPATAASLPSVQFITRGDVTTPTPVRFALHRSTRSFRQTVSHSLPREKLHPDLVLPSPRRLHHHP